MAHDVISQLAEELGRLLPDEQAIRDTLWDAGLEYDDLTLGLAPAAVWGEVLNRCMAEGLPSMESLLAEISDRRADQPQLKDALRRAADWFEEPAQIEPTLRDLVVRDPLAGVARLRQEADRLGADASVRATLADLASQLGKIAERRKSEGRSLVSEPEWAGLTRQCLEIADRLK